MRKERWSARPRWTKWMGAMLLLGVAAVAVVAISCTSRSRATANASSSEELIARGRRITYTSGCMDCHTPGTFYGNSDTTRNLSGSELGWEGPWGVTFPRNLTPDVETGIGSWSEEEIITAVRQGRRPDNTPLLPPMPWPMYAHLTDDDARALAAYLKSIPPVKHQVPDRIPPGQKYEGPRLSFPPPPAWDGQNLSVAAATSAH